MLMYVFQRLTCVFVASNLPAMARQVSPPSMTYHFLHLGVDPRIVGAGGMGYAVPSMTVVVGGGPVVGVDVVGVDIGPAVVLVGGIVVVTAGSPSAPTQYDWPDSVKLPHVAVIEGF